MLSFLDGMELGRRLFAQGKWWIKVKDLIDGYCLVVKHDAIMPAQIFIVKPSMEESQYQEILFRKFDEASFKLRKFKEKIKCQK